MADVRWVDNHIEIDPVKNPLKLTGTRLAAILGLNRWKTPFSVWCEVTRTYREPFVDTIYTIAGKTIEPKQAEYMKRSYAMSNLLTPKEVYGEDHFRKTRGDFFPDEPVFGGSWDYLLTDSADIPTTVLEMKTTKRVEDWRDQIPEYYAIQAALYAYLLGVDDVLMVASVLEDADYEAPEKFVPSVHNTIVRPFKVSHKYPQFSEMLEEAMQWWNAHVVTGISPAYDEKADADILKQLRTNNPDPDADLKAIMDEGDRLTAEIDAANAAVKDLEKRLGVIKRAVKEYMSKQFRDGDKNVSLSSEHYNWVMTRSTGVELDIEAMKRDGVYDKYNVLPKETVRMTVSAKKEDK